MKSLVVLAFALIVDYYTFPEMKWIDTQVRHGFTDMGSCETAAKLAVLDLDSENATVQAHCLKEDSP